MSKPARVWVVVGSGLVVGSVVWLIVNPGALAAIFLAVGVVVLLIAVMSRLSRLTIPEVDVPKHAAAGGRTVFDELPATVQASYGRQPYPVRTRVAGDGEIQDDGKQGHQLAGRDV